MADARPAHRLKSIRRPHKSAGTQAHRVKVQKRRLLALGVPEAALKCLNGVQIRALLRHPTKVAAQFAVK